jgi:hypothetical protein
MYVCRLLNNIEFRANPSLYTIAQYINNSVDSTMIKIRRKKNITKNFLKWLENLLRSDHANSTDSLTQ